MTKISAARHINPAFGFAILVLGLLAFILDTVAGLLFGKLMSVMSGRKINPLIGAAGISAFPMAGRLSAQMAQEEDYEVVIKGREAYGTFGRYVYMPDTMGYGMALALVLFSMGTWYAVVVWNEDSNKLLLPM